ncbi:hypothetical protein [Zunongwangia sp. HRR-M8]|uniref:hypothetical protein n=1 Tax=Zunongwangia sp. HRR-M8 TaxID=3015170 RepID=UPI0022DE1B8B|nr:hypothetical protein [Zunongwangia sp. HRR-M8]WBL23760.1 hypothetical protein PBT89_07315 [Zunongwangia sp. HRR-M8]
MIKTLKNILIVFAAFIIVFPAIANCAHIFSGHHHGLCDNYAKQHIHQSDLDCNLAKFHQSPSFNFGVFTFEPVVINTQVKHIFSVYDFLSDYQKLSFELRGPPGLS